MNLFKSTTFLLIIISSFGFAQKDFSYLDNDRGTSMEPILARAEPLIDDVEKDGFEIVRMEFDIITTEKETFRTLHKDWSYGIVAFGDYRIEDIDVSVYEEVRGRWELVEKDAENDDEAMVIIKPYRTGDYKIVISVYKFNKNFTAGHYGLLVIHE